MRALEWPVERHAGLSRGHIAQDEQALLVPTETPCQDGGQDDDDEPVRHVRDSGKARLKTFLDPPELLRERRLSLVHDDARRAREGGGDANNTDLQTMMTANDVTETMAVSRCVWPASAIKKAILATLLLCVTPPISRARGPSPSSGIS